MTTPDSDPISQLYQQSSVLDQELSKSADISQLQKVYRSILDGAKGSPAAKKLTAQLIPRYFKYFPSLHNEALSVLFDLCEEEDMQIRILAVRSFSPLCKEDASILVKVADVLGQLLQAEAQMELDTVNNSLLSLLKINPKDVFQSLFNQILHRDDNQREKAIQFLRDRVMPLHKSGEGSSLFTEETERFLADNIKKVMEDVSEDEFRVFMSILLQLHLFKNSKSELVDILVRQAELNQPFQVDDSDQVERFLSLMQMSVAFQEGSAFLDYVARQVIPSFDKLAEDRQLRLLKSTAELSPFADVNQAKELLPLLYELLGKNIGSPESSVNNSNDQPSTDTPTTDNNNNSSSSNNNNNDNNASSSTNFSQVECLLFAMLQLGVKAPQEFKVLSGTAPPSAAASPQDNDAQQQQQQQLKQQYKQFHARLVKLDGLTDVYLKELTAALPLLAGQPDKKATATLALSTSQNIKHLIKALISPRGPSLALAKTLHLSWSDKTSSGSSSKRKQPEIATLTAVPVAAIKDKETKRPRGGHGGIYIPPARLGHAATGSSSTTSANVTAGNSSVPKVASSGSTLTVTAANGNSANKGPILRYSRGGSAGRGSFGFRGRGGRW